MTRTLILGGGVIGLSIAYELACRGEAVTVLDQFEFGKRASFTGAGVLLPANGKTAIHPFDQLNASSIDLHELWAKQLLDETGIDNGFRKSGGIYIARTTGEIALLAGTLEHWRQREIKFKPLDREQVVQRHPALRTAVEQASKFRAVEVDCEYQFRNPDHIRALITACRQRGVLLESNVGLTKIVADDRKIVSIVAGDRSWQADQFCISAGPWTEQLIEPLGVTLPMQPVRGHIVLYKIAQPVMTAIVNEGSRYLVPRDDGHVLAGSTIEEAGFDDSVVDAEIDGLKRWANSVLPALDNATVVDSWAGLRPGTYDGFPYIGRCSGYENAFVSAGHFKAGLQVSTGNAIVMADLIQGLEPAIDLQPFSVSRASDNFYSKSIDSK